MFTAVPVSDAARARLIEFAGEDDHTTQEIAMWKLAPWRQVLLIFAALLAALFAAGQAIAFAWLSALPEQVSQLESLRTRFWNYAAASAVLLVFDAVLLLNLVRKIKSRRNRSKDVQVSE
ncbi:MAG: hypothetical protein KGN16_01005 [Burkholderiales bacterium]|nr:hypothetical protein [Burkholderiales bacterium]